jgi:hypothetical protein
LKQEAWTKNKFDEVFAKKGRLEKADVTKQHAENTPTVNTRVNIIKNKLPDVFAKKGRRSRCWPWSAKWSKMEDNLKNKFNNAT